MRRWPSSIAICLPFLLCLSAGAQTATVYRCEAADGGVSLQDRPCPEGARTVERRIRTPAPAASTPPPPPAAPAPAPAAALPAAPAAAYVPPPPLYECIDYDGTRRVDEILRPRRRCVPLGVLGLDRPGAAIGTACTWVEEACYLLPHAEACEDWRGRLVQAEREAREASSSTVAAKREELARVRGIVREHCR